MCSVFRHLLQDLQEINGGEEVSPGVFADDLDFGLVAFCQWLWGGLWLRLFQQLIFGPGRRSRAVDMTVSEQAVPNQYPQSDQARTPHTSNPTRSLAVLPPRDRSARTS